MGTEWKQREKLLLAASESCNLQELIELAIFSASTKFKMARDKKDNSKAKEKKAKRLEMEKKMNERVAMVKKANEVTDPLAELPSFKRFNKNGLDLKMETTRVTDLDEHSKTWLFDLLRANMKEMYEKSEWGWNEKNKAEEMFDDHAWYLVARENNESAAPVAFAHFRYDMDYDDEVLSHKADMRKIMLTCFKHNPLAHKFFKGAMKYERDETNYEDDVYEQADYEILSKFNKKKLAREEAEEAAK